MAQEREKMTDRLTVAVLFGGRSAEHEVSLQSAKNVIDALDRDKYDVVLIGIDKTGGWYLSRESDYLLNADDPKHIALHHQEQSVALLPGEPSRELVSLSRPGELGLVDVVFPVLHGPYGEDGTIQGLLKLTDVPFVGAGVLGSAVGMDKDVMKRLFRDAGIPTPRFLVFRSGEEVDAGRIEAELGWPVFVKPANLGSSVGVHMVKSTEELAAAVEDAFHYDRKVIVEERIAGREIECSVLGNDDPIASVPGEVIPNLENHEYYDYDAKYIDEDGAALYIPAQLTDATVRRVQELAVHAFKALCCEGMGRVDMFLRDDGEVFVNEINTIPGFTRISMYPKLWEASGIPSAELVDRLIQLALVRHGKESELRSSRE
jgi:D-alanine-D-alanine ligase